MSTSLMLLMLAISWAESRFDPKAVSPKGAVGLFQLTPIAVQDARLVCPDIPKKPNLKDPNTNFSVAVCFVRVVANNYARNETELIIYYNGGIRQMNNYRTKRPLAAETRKYLKAVKTRLRLYRTAQADMNKMKRLLK